MTSLINAQIKTKPKHEWHEVVQKISVNIALDKNDSNLISGQIEFM